MASSQNCEYCGTTMRSDQQVCPGCGAPNPNYVPEKETGPRPGGPSRGKPTTIEELKAFCAEKGMPLQKMRFFIGTDERSPRAFGIYRDGSDFVVYKNKADGTRALRYRGPDEAFAVNEIYMKLLEEHRKRAAPQARSSPQYTRSGGGSGGKRPNRRMSTLIVIIALVVIFAFNAIQNRLGHRDDGYYRIGSDLFYRYGTSWFLDSGSSYGWSEVDGFPYDDPDTYYQGSDYDSSWGSSDFSDSTYWDDLHSSDSDSDWDYDDYDYDSWDSGDTDWDSDW